MKNLVNEINREMLANGDAFQITSVEGPKMVSMPVEKFAELIEYLACNKELQNKICDEYWDIEREQSLLDETDRAEGTCYAAYYDGSYRTDVYMNVYNEFKAKDVEDDDDFPF